MDVDSHCNCLLFYAKSGGRQGPEGPPHGPPMTPWAEDDDGATGDQSNTSSATLLLLLIRNAVEKLKDRKNQLIAKCYITPGPYSQNLTTGLLAGGDN